MELEGEEIHRERKVERERESQGRDGETMRERREQEGT